MENFRFINLLLYKETEITWQVSPIGFPHFLYEPTILFQNIYSLIPNAVC